MIFALLLIGFSVLGMMAQVAPMTGTPQGVEPGGMGPGDPGGFGRPQQITLGKAQYPGDVAGILDIPYSEAPGVRPVQLDLYYTPDSHIAKPAVIWVHGGAFRGGNSRMSISSFGPFDKVLAGLAARGYVAIGVNYRLSGEAKFPAAVQDVKAAVQWLRANASKYDIDPKRIAIWGESAGGYLAAEVGTSCDVKELEGIGENAKQSSCVQAVVDWYGPIDFPSIAEQKKSSNGKSQGPGMMQGPPPGMMGSGKSPEESFLGCEYSSCKPELLRQANPISFINANTPPFLIMHGDSDFAVPWEQSQELNDALKSKGVPIQFKLLPGLNHMFMGATADQSKEILNTVFDFLDTTFQLKPGNAKK
jgi:acetyl esterase/lipase